MSQWHSRAENGLAAVSKLTKYMHDGPGRLRVKAGRGLIQEE
jgi:hypothetical protein